MILKLLIVPAISASLAPINHDHKSCTGIIDHVLDSQIMYWSHRSLHIVSVHVFCMSSWSVRIFIVLASLI